MRNPSPLTSFGGAIIGLGLLMFLWAAYRASGSFGWNIFLIVEGLLSVVTIILGIVTVVLGLMGKE